ncbi:MAG: hypothetical protein FJ147_15000 [Deltaproteobacteria bacterium]|nr:hypothetical protein [Deltaproteobacteria bacterium]
MARSAQHLNGKPAIVGHAPVGAPASHIAVNPDMTFAVAGSGDKERILSVIDTQSKQVVRKLEVPTPLTAGGYLIAVQPGMKLGDTIGR